jgi:orotate phosphoribosyltransferase
MGEWLVNALRPHVHAGGDFDLAAGGRSDWYLDARPVLYGPERAIVAHMVDDALYAIKLDAIGGVGYGGLPVGLLAAERRKIRSFAVRLESKGHGRTGKVVGPVGPGDRVALVEDVFNTGSSVCSAVEALRDIGAVVAAVVAVVNRGNPALKVVYGDVPFFSLLVASDLEEIDGPRG